MTIGRVKECTCRAHFDAVAALRTVEPSAVRADDRVRAAPARLDSILAHPLVAHARATLTQDATLWIVGDNRREIFFRRVVLALREALFQPAPIEDHLLQLALAPAITDGTIQRVIGEQEL